MNRLPVLLLLASLAAPAARAAAGSPSYAVTLESATHAVLAAHPDLAGDAIELPARIEARTPAPALLAGPVERAAPSGNSTESVAHIRIHCQAEACLPFYVSVHLSGAELSGSEAQQPGIQTPSSPRFAAARAQNSAAAAPVQAPVLRPGQRASMVIDSGLLHIRVPVTCLQSGAAGSMIRVAGPARRKVYEAAIVDGSTVRGTL